MTKTFSHILFIVFFLMVCSAGATVYAESFQYSGYLESDSVRSASMNLSISGPNVTGSLTLNPVCQSNARLPGAEFKLNGTVDGKWEGEGSISGTWTGVVRWCEKSEDRSGSFSISLGQGNVMFSANGSYYNRYIFTPTGKVSAPAVSPAATGAGTEGEPPASVEGDPSYSSLAPPTSGFGISADMMKNLFGVIKMSLNETRFFAIPLGLKWFRSDTGRRVERFSNCYDAGYMAEPGSILSQADKVGGDGINIKAVGEGIGKVWGSKSCYDCTWEGGLKGHCDFKGVWLVLAGEKGLKEYEEETGQKRPPEPYSAPVPDIAKAVIKGRVVMVGTKTPVGNAQISLIARQGGVYSRDNWKSKPGNGAFSLQADNMLISGTYEVMAQLRSPEMGTREDPFTVYKDLWPIKKYFVTITQKSAKKGAINVGDIEMDTVDNIFNKGNGRDSSENRTPVTKESPSKPPATGVKADPPAYNPLGDPNLKGPKSGTPADLGKVDKLGSDFQEGSNKTKKTGQNNSQQIPISQPESYTGSRNNGDTGYDYEQPAYPPFYPPYDYPQHIGGGYDHPHIDRGGTWREPPCDSSQKQSAYNAGYNCGKKTKQGSGAMPGDCASVLQTYRNIESKSGWGRCLSDAFDAGYREGGQQFSSPHSPPTSKTSAKFTAELENKAGENVHIFVEGQDNFGPQNKLGPGQKRTIALNISAGQTIKFAAGRNGQVLARCNWTAGSGASGRAVYVKFSGSGTLTCTSK